LEAKVKEAADALSFFATSEGAWHYFALLFPGIIAVAVYDLRVPGERRKWNEMGIALVAYSILIDLLAAAYLALWPLSAASAAVQRIGFALIGDLAVPTLVGWLAVDVREALARRGLILSAMPKAWDAFFYRIRNEPVALILTLSDGRRIGGFWAEDPLASSFPADEDLLITVPCLIDQETGLILQRIGGSKGLLVKRDDVITIEAFDAQAAIAVDSGRATQRAAGAQREEAKTNG
jgi:hypothetical protein